MVMLLGSGCAVGPDFERPPAPDVANYTDEPLPEQTNAADVEGGEAQQFSKEEAISARWWESFGSEPLNALVEEAIRANPTMAAAQASLRQAQETVYASYSGFFPNIDFNTSATRQKIAGASFGDPFAPPQQFTLYNASVNVSYAFDFFGGIRRQAEYLQAQADYQGFQLEATYLTLIANVITTAVQEASLREQIVETQKIISIGQQQLRVLEDQFKMHAVTVTPLVSQKAAIAQAQASLAALRKERAQRYDQLAILCGHFPGEKLGIVLTLHSLHLPKTLPLSLPSHLVAQRPDIRSAEEQLHSASAQIGMATAAMLPQITLNGSYGAEATAGDTRLSSPSSRIWNLVGGLTQPIFHGGQLLHQRRAAVAGYEKAFAQYRNTILLAFQNVADTLNALQYDADALAAQVAGAHAATKGLDAAREQFGAGIIGYLLLLDAERNYQQASIGLIQARAQRYADTAALFQALGGGWWNKSIQENSGDGNS